MTGVVVDGHRVATTPEPPFTGNGPLVVFVHGAGHDRSVWQEQRAHLEATGLTAVTLDLPGHGDSEGPARASIPALADWLARVVAELDAAGAHLCGHSMGSLVALEAAARHAALVRSLTLMGTAPAMAVHPDLLRAADSHDPSAIDMIVKWSRGRRIVSTGEPEAPRKTSHTRAMVERCPPDVLAVDLRACNTYTGGRARAAAVLVPTLIIAGGADRMTPAPSAAQLAEVISHAQYVELDGVGHDLMSEAPEAVNDALRRFVTSIG